MHSIKDSALAYAARGWHVFPCHTVGGGRCSCGKSDCGGSAGKHPRTRNGFRDATTDRAQVKEWWTVWPDANIGIATGSVSGLLVADQDGPEASKELDRLQALHGPFSPTPKATTGRGEHLYFRYPVGRTIGSRIKKGGLPLDVKSDGGYVIAPPSSHRSGTAYTWVNNPEQVELAEPPDWLLDYFDDPRNPVKAQAITDELDGWRELDLRTVPGVKEGGRHDKLTRLVGAELGRRTDPVEVLDLSYRWADKCDPPMDHGEVYRIVTDLRDKDANKTSDGIITEVQKPNWPTLAPEAFHGLAGEIVKAIEPNTEADPAAVLVQLLALFGNEVGRGPHVLVGPTRHYANLFVLVAGESSKAKKGTSLADAKAPFGDIIKPRIGSGLSSGEGLIARVTDDIFRKEPIRDKDRKVIGYQDVLETPAAKDKRLIVLETEFGTVLQVMRRDGNTVSGLIRSAWDDGCLESMTKVRRRATDAHITIIGHITTPELKKLLSDTDLFNGFANRFLWVVARASRLLPRPVSHDLLDYERRLAEAATVAKTRTVVNRDAEAESLWDELYHGELDQAYPGILDTVTGRAKPQVIRLSLIYALLDKSPIVGVEHLRAAMAVWLYCVGSARVIFGEATGNPIDDTILAAVRKQPLKTADIHRLFSNHQSAWTLKAALQRLVNSGLIRCQRVRTGGRPSEVWAAA